jgi:hypothetical protein
MSQILVTGEAKVRDIQGPVVANSGVITALDGDASQYVRGDGTLADFPTSTGGGSSVSYYLNSSVSQGTIGGVAYRQLSKTPISGAGTDITASTNGYIASYITDANDPALLEVPAGNFNCEFYFSVNSNNHNPYVYAELYKYDGTNFTLLGSSQSIPEYLTNGTTLSAYYFAIPVAVAALTITDRLAIRIYVNVDGRVVTLHTENNHLCQVVTTFSKGLTSLNNLTRQVQFLGTGTSGTDFNISSSTATHTFNLPVASATNTGKLSSTDWSTFNNKQAALSFTAPLVNTSNTISIPAATSLVDGYLDNLDWVKFNTAYNDSIISAAVTGTTTKTLTLNQQDGGTITASWTDDNTDAVTSVFGRTGAVVAVSGDYNTSQVTENTNLYFTDARSRAALSAGTGISYNNTTGVISSTITQYTDALARAAISLTTTGTSGAATYNNTTGVFNIPQYQAALTNPVTGTGTTNYITKWTSGSAVGNSTLREVNGSLGLGIAPSNWGSPFTAIQGGTYGGNIGFQDNNADMKIGINYYYNGGYIYNTTGYGASQINIRGGVSTLGSFEFLVADAGTAGNTVTFQEVFRTSGTNLLIGTITDAGYKLDVNGTGRFNNNVTVSSTSSAGLIAATNSTTGYAYVDLINNGASGKNYQIGVGGNATASGYANNLYIDLVGVGTIMTLTSGRNVGIGTSTPTGTYGKLSVAGGISILNDNNAKFDIGRYSSGAPYSYIKIGTNSDSLRITNATDTADLFYFQNLGSFGISTDNPVNTAWGNATNTKQLSIVGTNYGVVNLTGGTGGTLKTYSMGVGDGNFYMCYDNTLGVHGITMSSGNILIKTTGGVSGGGALQVNGNVNINGVFQINGVTIGGGGGSGVTGSGTTNYVTKWTGSTTLGNGLLYDNGTNVWLGGTNMGSDARFGISNGGQEAMEFNAAISSNLGRILYYNRGAGAYMGSQNVASYFQWQISGTDKMRLSTSGNLLINRTTDAGYNFDVNGTGRFTGQLTGTDALFAGSVTASSGFFDTSDSRLKIIVKDYEQPKGIENVAARMYVKNNRKELGYFAQDLQEILPSAVGQGDDGFLTLSYSQVHTAKIAHLEKEIAQLEELIKSLIK